MRIGFYLAIISLGSLSACGGGCKEEERYAAAPEPQVADVTAPKVAPDAAVDALEERDAARRRAMLEALAKLEVPGFTRSRGAVRQDHVVLSFEQTTPNDRGQSARVDVTLGFCDQCPEVNKATREAEREARLEALGEVHAKNPDLVFEIQDFEFAPMRVGVSTFARSFVANDEGRSALMTFDADWVDSGNVFHFSAYPAAGFPESAEAQAASLTAAELGGAVKAIFQAMIAVVAPPQ